MLEFVSLSGPMGADPKSPESRGRRFRLMRQVMGEHMTQTIMARAIGVTQGSWTAYENGTRFPKRANLDLLVTATHFPKEWIEDGNIRDIGPDLMRRLIRAEKELEQAQRAELKKKRS